MIAAFRRLSAAAAIGAIAASAVLAQPVPSGASPPPGPTGATITLSTTPGKTVGPLMGSTLSWDPVDDPTLQYYGVSVLSAGVSTSCTFPVFGASTYSLKVPIGIGASDAVCGGGSDVTPPYHAGFAVMALFGSPPGLAPRSPIETSSPTYFTLAPLTRASIYRVPFRQGTAVLSDRAASKLEEMVQRLSTFGPTCGLTGAKSINARMKLVGRTSGESAPERRRSLAKARIATVRAALASFYAGTDSFPIRSKAGGTRHPLGDNLDPTWRRADRSVTMVLTTTNEHEPACID